MPSMQGCLDDLVDYEEEQYGIIGPIGIAFGLFQVRLAPVFHCMQ